MDNVLTKMRTYSANFFRPANRPGKPWRGMLFVFIVGVVGGVIIDQALSARTPVELIISAPALPETAEVVAAPELWSESKNISVRVPKSNQVVASPLVVEGLERTFEQNVVVRLRDGKGGEMVKVAVTGTAPDVDIHGPYRAELKFEKPATKTGTLEVFQASAKDGSEIDMVSVPVRFE